LREHIEVLESEPPRDFFSAEDAKLNIGTSKQRAKVLVSCDCAKTFSQMTMPTICSICGDLIASCKHRKQKEAQVLWAMELPKKATHIRLSYLEEGQLDTLEKDVVIDKKPTLELGTLWEEYGRRTKDYELQPVIVSFMKIEDLYLFITEYCEFMTKLEQDPEEYGMEREGEYNARNTADLFAQAGITVLDTDGEGGVTLPADGFFKNSAANEPTGYKGVTHTHKVESSQWQVPMDSLFDFVQQRYGTKEVAAVALYYVLKAIHKYNNKPRVQLFYDVLCRRVDEYVLLHVESLVSVTSRAIPKDLNWSVKLEEQLVKRLYSKPLQKDETKIAQIRGEFGLFCVHYLGSKYDANPSAALMKEVFMEFIATLSVNLKDPYFEKWTDTFETVRYQSTKDLTEVTTCTTETLLNVGLPAWMTHADAIIARKHSLAVVRKMYAYEVYQQQLEDNPGDETLIQQGITKEVGVKELSQMAASFEVVHCADL